MNKRMLIYVASAYTADTKEKIEENVRYAILAGQGVLLKGHYPYIPHFTHYFDKVCPMGYETYMAWDLEFIKVCDGFLYLRSSPGADRELRQAEEMGKLIYRRVREIPNFNPHS